LNFTAATGAAGVAGCGTAAAAAGLGFAAADADDDAVAAVAPAATTTAVPGEAGFTVERFPAGRAPAIPGKLGFTVIRAVSFGGWLFTTDVPDFVPAPDAGGTGEGAVAAGFNGVAPVLDASA
jgi:hypothetical protein